MVRSNDIMTSYQHYVTAEQYISILQAVKLVFYEFYETSYLEPTESEKELALARIADIF